MNIIPINEKGCPFETPSLFLFGQITRGGKGPIDPPEGGEISPVRTARLMKPDEFSSGFYFECVESLLLKDYIPP